MVFGLILYRRSVVGEIVNYTGVIYGATLPVLKNEIKDFFFARLGTGRTSQNHRATAAYMNIYNCINEIIIYM